MYQLYFHFFLSIYLFNRRIGLFLRSSSKKKLYVDITSKFEPKKNTMLKAEETIFYSIESTIKAYRKYAQANIKKIDPSLTIDQSILILKLIDNPEISQKNLAKLLFKDVASVTRMIELLVKTEFIIREPNPNDRRQNNLIITAKAKKIMKKVSKIIKANRDFALKDISDKEIEKCKKTLNAILNNLGNKK